MNDVLNPILGFLTGVFGIVLGLAYFLPVLVLVLVVVIALYLHRRQGRSTVFSGEEPGRHGKRRK